MPPDPFTALDRPRVGRPLLGVLDHRREPNAIGGEPGMAHDRLVQGHDFDRDRSFVGVHADHDWLNRLIHEWFS